MKIPTGLLALWLLILLDDPVEGETASKEIPVKARQVESSDTIIDQISIIASDLGTPTERTTTTGKQLPKSDSITEDKKDSVDPIKVSEEPQDSITATTESVILRIEGADASIFPEPSQDTNKKCSNIICKFPPPDAQCNPISENPAVSILGPTGDCCPFFMCTRTDGSFFAHYAGAHIERRQDILPPVPVPTPNNVNPPQMMMTQFFAGAASPSWPNNQFGAFRPPPPLFPFGLIGQPMYNDRNPRPFTEMHFSMGRRVDLPIPMQFQQQQTSFQQQQVRRSPPMSLQQQPNLQFQPQPTIDRDPQHPAWNNIFRERRSDFFNGNPIRNQFIPTAYPGALQSQSQPDFRGQQGLTNFF